MKYPYTIIKREDIDRVYKTLKNFGYYSNFNLGILRWQNPNLIWVVIDDCNKFGNFCFYLEGNMSEYPERVFIKDLYQFLKIAAEYKDCTEY